MALKLCRLLSLSVLGGSLRLSLRLGMKTLLYLYVKGGILEEIVVVVEFLDLLFLCLGFGEGDTVHGSHGGIGLVVLGEEEGIGLERLAHSIIL